jgi:hypothetical protein
MSVINTRKHTNKQPSNKTRSTPKKGSNKKRRQQSQNQQQGKQFSAPVQTGRSNLSKAASIKTQGNSCRITHTEFIGTIVSLGQAFQLIKRLRCNPGSSSTFSWLATQAVHWETFKFIKLIFRFQNTCPTTTGGDIVISPDYDSADGNVAAALTEQQVYNNVDTIMSSVWKEIHMKLDPKKLNRLFKSHAIMSDLRFANTVQDQKTIDPAQVNLFLDAVPAATICGKLFVDYIVELQTPQGVTEDSNVGGAGVRVPGTLIKGSVKPIIANQVDIANSEAQPIGRSTPSIAGAFPEMTYPTSNLFQFSQDWTGILSTHMGSADPLVAMANLPRIFKSVPGKFAEVLNDNAASLPGLIDEISPSIDSGANLNYDAYGSGFLTDLQASFPINAKAGDLIKLLSPNSAGANIPYSVFQFAASSLGAIA